MLSREGKALTLFEGESDGVWVDVAKIGREGVCILDVDRQSWADEGEEGVEGDEGWRRRHEARRDDDYGAGE